MMERSTRLLAAAVVRPAKAVAGLCLLVVTVLGLLVIMRDSAATVAARQRGITGYSGNPGTNGGAICTTCHSGGRAPDVQLEGPTTVTIGSTNTYTLTISGGQRSGGGLDVSATTGNLDVPDGDEEVQLVQGEVTHIEPKRADRGGRVVFNFLWIAPSSPSRGRLFAAGNSVNMNQSPLGDAPNTDTLIISVVAGPPTPTPFPTVEVPYPIAVADLANPHGLSIVGESTLLVSEGGTTGQAQPGRASAGAGDGRVLRIALDKPDQRQPVVSNLSNAVNAGGGVVGGNHAVAFRLPGAVGQASTVTLVAQAGGPNHSRPDEAAKVLLVQVRREMPAFTSGLRRARPQRWRLRSINLRLLGFYRQPVLGPVSGLPAAVSRSPHADQRAVTSRCAPATPRWNGR